MSSLEIRYVRNASLTVGVLFQSKWRVQILCALRSGPVRLGQLARLIPEASKKMLTQNLRQLETDGIISRRDMSGVVLHVEYELHESMKEGVCALLDHLVKWGDFHFEPVEGNDNPQALGSSFICRTGAESQATTERWDNTATMSPARFSKHMDGYVLSEVRVPHPRLITRQLSSSVLQTKRRSAKA